MAAEVRTRRYLNGALQSTAYSAVTDDGDGVYRIPITESSTEDEIRITLVESTDHTVEYSEEKTILISDGCANQVNLRWINIEGGENWWVFQVNQEYTFTYDNGKKAKRLVLFAENLTLNQWETINGLNTVGEIYKNVIPELTTSVKKTSSRIGQQDYMIDEDDNEMGVLVIPTENLTYTKQVQHQIQITIELPETILQ